MCIRDSHRADHLTVLKEHQRSDGVNTEALDELRLLVVVDLAGDEGIGICLLYTSI